MARVLKYEPELVKIQDDVGNVPLHSLCKNTTSDEETLLVIFWLLVEHYPDAIFKSNKMQERPINILEKRLNEGDDGFLNPYEKNLNE